MKTEKTYNNMKSSLEGNFHELERENVKLRGYVSYLEEQLQSYRVIANEYEEVKKSLEKLLQLIKIIPEETTVEDQVEEARRRG